MGGMTRLKGMGMFMAATWLGPALIMLIWSWVWKYMFEGRPAKHLGVSCWASSQAGKRTEGQGAGGNDRRVGEGLATVELSRQLGSFQKAEASTAEVDAGLLQDSRAAALRQPMQTVALAFLKGPWPKPLAEARTALGDLAGEATDTYRTSSQGRPPMG